jgi:hypothetical protein
MVLNNKIKEPIGLFDILVLVVSASQVRTALVIVLQLYYVSTTFREYRSIGLYTIAVRTWVRMLEKTA